MGADMPMKPPTRQGISVSNFARRYNFVPVNMMSYTSGPLETFVGPSGSSTTDFIMIPDSLKRAVEYCRVLNDELQNTSDHRPIELGLRIEDLMARTFEVNTLKKIKWSKTSPEVIKEMYTDPVNLELGAVFT